MSERSVRPVVEYSRNAVLDVEQVALGLGVSVSTVERNDLPCFYLGPHVRRFIWGTVLDFLARKGAA